MNLLNGEQSSLIFQFNQPFIARKKCYIATWTKKREIIVDVNCPTSKNEKSVYISTNATSSFYEFKKREASCYKLNIPFKEQEPTLTLFGGDGTYRFTKKTSRNYEKPSLLLKSFFRQPQSTAIEIETKKDKINPYIAQTC